jgi:CBS domain containing-hemolysin-like protein
MYKKLAAYFMDTLGEIPKAGDTIDLCGKRFIVISMDRNRVHRVRIEGIPPSNDNADTSSDT